MIQRKKKIFALVITGVSLLGFLYVAHGQISYWIMLRTVWGARDVVLSSYELTAPPATTTSLYFGDVEVSVPWSSAGSQRGGGDSVQWIFDGGSAQVAILRATSTRTIWEGDTAIRNLMSLNTVSAFELERMVWGVQKHDLPLWATKNNHASKGVVLATLKAVKYSSCDTLLEFRNMYGAQGVICETRDQGGDVKSIVYVYIDNDSEFTFFIKPNHPHTRDSIIASIKKR